MSIGIYNRGDCSWLVAECVYCEPWIGRKLFARLMEYKTRYPNFDIQRVMEEVQEWEPKFQRWAPYMKDKDIRAINRAYHKSQSIRSLASNDHL